MRGKGSGKKFLTFRTRITPAYAGKRCHCICGGNRAEDHPRLCGEKLKRIASSSLALGSPPPMRGKGQHRKKSTRSRRITPAYAGKSAEYSRVKGAFQDHPRLCGEKILPDFSGVQSGGSPPPMRGKVGQKMVYRERIRITPAYAGKRLVLLRLQDVQQDHPRLCGEKGIP